MTQRTLTPEEHDQIIDSLIDAGLQWENTVRLVPSYSGRNMYGETCFGLVVEDHQSIFFALGTLVSENEDLSMSLMNAYKIDNMGLEYIVYFPGYLWTESIFNEATTTQTGI